MQSRQTTEVVLRALLMAVWRRKPKDRVLIHSDQGSQFTSMDWAAFTRAHNLEHSMSRRGNYHDNAVAESFFNLLKRKRIRRRTYKTREEARRDVFDYVEMFYNPKRKHVTNGMLSPMDFERQRKMTTKGVQKTRGYSGKLRDECLNREIFYILREAQVLIEQWRKFYNTERPHSSLGYSPPAPKAILPRHDTPLTLRTSRRIMAI